MIICSEIKVFKCSLKYSVIFVVHHEYPSPQTEVVLERKRSLLWEAGLTPQLLLRPGRCVNDYIPKRFTSTTLYGVGHASRGEDRIARLDRVRLPGHADNSCPAQDIPAMFHIVRML